ncbi:MAG: EamA family transporter [Dysgonamonadaceae bacterium]|jgi:undecaprenyl phosphate-alpha-L-ara4N flippase subunit ArnE|nr:EamA family transporter [Dysgonamonadaceae bacterium]
MLRVILLAVIQAVFLSAGQVFLKLALNRMDHFGFTWLYFGKLLTNRWLAATGLSMGVAAVLWFYIIKHFDFSVAYPVTGIAYIFGMLAAVFVFHEPVPVTRWIGVLLIMVGVMLIVR